MQTSPPLHHPQHNPPGPVPRHRPAAADPDALLHTPDPDPEPVYSRWQGARYLQRLQDVKSASFSFLHISGSGANVEQYNFRLQALAGNLPGVKKASW